MITAWVHLVGQISVAKTGRAVLTAYHVAHFTALHTDRKHTDTALSQFDALPKAFQLTVNAYHATLWTSFDLSSTACKVLCCPVALSSSSGLIWRHVQLYCRGLSCKPIRRQSPHESLALINMI